MDISNYGSSHRIVVNGDSELDLEVENRVVEVALEHGDGISVRFDSDVLDDGNPRKVELLAPFEKRDVDIDGYSDYSADVDDASDEFLHLLSFDDDDKFRIFGLHTFVITLEGEAIYYSVPHEPHIREVYVRPTEDGYLDDIRRIVDTYDGVALFEQGAIDEWSVEDGGKRYDYELVPENLCVERKAKKRCFDLARLERVEVEGCRLHLVWETKAVTRVFRPILGLLGRVPPERIGFDSSARARGVAESIEDVGERCGYDYAVEFR